MTPETGQRSGGDGPASLGGLANALADRFASAGRSLRRRLWNRALPDTPASWQLVGRSGDGTAWVDRETGAAVGCLRAEDGDGWRVLADGPNRDRTTVFADVSRRRTAERLAASHVACGLAWTEVDADAWRLADYDRTPDDGGPNSWVRDEVRVGRRRPSRVRWLHRGTGDRVLVERADGSATRAERSAAAYRVCALHTRGFRSDAEGVEVTPRPVSFGVATYAASVHRRTLGVLAVDAP